MEKQYLIASEVAALISKRWTRSMIHTYLKRGSFPDPVMYIGKQPVWTLEQVENFKKERGM